MKKEKNEVMTMIGSVLFVLLSLFISCSKVEKQPAYYRYKDVELPFAMVLEHPLGYEGAKENGGFQFNADLAKYDRKIGKDYARMYRDYLPGKGYKDTFGGKLCISCNLIGHILYAGNEYPSPSDKPILCFDDARRTKEGNFFVNLKQLAQKADGKYEAKDLIAELIVLRSSIPEDADVNDNDKPTPFPGESISEKHLLIPKLPSRSLPHGKDLFLEIRYFVITPNEPDYHKAAKEKANKQLCEAAKSFTWVVSKDLGNPPDWSRIKFTSELPATRRN